MIEIAVGSTNPTKLRAVEAVLARCIEEPVNIAGYAVESGVSDQPMSDFETILGARVRAEEARLKAPEARYSIGMEGGARVVGDSWFEMGWVCLRDCVTLKSGIGGTQAIRIPYAVQQLMEEQGLDESQAVASVYGTDTVASRDCSRIISGGIFTAEQVYSIGVLAAFADLRNQT